MLAEQRMAREEEQDAAWESTAVQNLVRYRHAETYYARFRVGDRTVRHSRRKIEPHGLA